MPYSDKEKQRSYQHQNYLANKELWRERNSKRRVAIREFVRNTKEQNPCSDCGEFYPFFVMDFDHLDDKVSNISRLLAGHASLGRIKEEIAKCELVCANCHRYRTQARQLRIHSPVAQ